MLVISYIFFEKLLFSLQYGGITTALISRALKVDINTTRLYQTGHVNTYQN